MFLNSFYNKRKTALDERSNFLSQLNKVELISFMNESWDKHCLTTNFLINFEDPLYDKNTLSSIGSFFETRQLLAIFQLFMKNYKLWRSGMPDLFLWKNERVFLVEVKSENDRLSEQQIAWIQQFNALEVPYELCHVSSKEGDPLWPLYFFSLINLK